MPPNDQWPMIHLGRQNDNFQFKSKLKIEGWSLQKYFYIFIWGSMFSTSTALCNSKKVSPCHIWDKWRLPLISMETWVIFVVWLLNNWLMNVAETFKGVLKHHFLPMNVVQFAKCMLWGTTLILMWSNHSELKTPFFSAKSRCSTTSQKSRVFVPTLWCVVQLNCLGN